MDIILTNTETVPGKQIISHMGIVSGQTVRTKHIGKELMAGFKNLIGGELKEYTQLLDESRQEAVQRMIDKAREKGANAVVNVRFSTSTIAQGTAELHVYGTAVKVE